MIPAELVPALFFLGVTLILFTIGYRSKVKRNAAILSRLNGVGRFTSEVTAEAVQGPIGIVDGSSWAHSTGLDLAVHGQINGRSMALLSYQWGYGNGRAVAVAVSSLTIPVFFYRCEWTYARRRVSAALAGYLRRLLHGRWPAFCDQGP